MSKTVETSTNSRIIAKFQQLSALEFGDNVTLTGPIPRMSHSSVSEIEDVRYPHGTDAKPTTGTQVTIKCREVNQQHFALVR